MQKKVVMFGCVYGVVIKRQEGGSPNVEQKCVFGAELCVCNEWENGEGGRETAGVEQAGKTVEQSHVVGGGGGGECE